jgi:hypothetical protein
MLILGACSRPTGSSARWTRSGFAAAALPDCVNGAGILHLSPADIVWLDSNPLDPETFPRVEEVVST